jgi:hypothetical protein
MRPSGLGLLCDPAVHTTASISSPTSSLRKESSPLVSPLHPREFRDLHISLSISDQKAYSTAATRLPLFGATVVLPPSPHPPDLIVADSIPAERPPSGPRILSVDQVPWLFWSQKKLAAFLCPTAQAMVVADCLRKSRPNFTLTKELPQLYFGPIPRWYTTTPFAPIPERLVEHRGRVMLCNADFEGNPPDDGYCELCLIGFAEAQEHRRSKEHQRRVNNGAFRRVDEVIDEVLAMRRIGDTSLTDAHSLPNRSGSFHAP